MGIPRHTLRSDIQALGKKPQLKDQTHIQEKREVLQKKIDSFHQQALHLFCLDTTSIIDQSTGTLEVVELDPEESDEEAFFLDEKAEWEEEEAEVPAEKVRLWLPSSFMKAERGKMGLGRVEEAEAKLREGQANDALEALRSGLAEKSLRFRTEVKPANSQKTMTRAWDSIHRADKQIKGAVWCYHLAQNALEGLGVSDELLARYQEIQKKDLKMSRDVVEENRVGQHLSELPWFWRLDSKWEGKEKRGEFLKECKYQLGLCLLGYWNDCSIAIYRVNWLRAKAGKERWEEEMELVKSEMDWTVNCFRYHQEIWKERAGKAKGPGHMAYAWKQHSNWAGWAETAESRFRELKND